MEFRIVTEQDQKAVEWLWSYCFENHEPFFSWYFKEYYQNSNTIGAFENEQLLSCLQLIPYTIYLRGQKLDTSYIVGLASYPEARRGGMVEKLLQESLKEMRQRGHYVSLLMPFKSGFYAPYQWELCYHHYKYTIPLENLRPLSSPYGNFVRVEGVQKLDAFNQVYLGFMQGKHGYVVRNSQTWQLLFEEHKGEGGYTYLLENQGNSEGYILYYLKDNKILVREMAYTNISAQKSLLQFLYNHRSQVKNLEWNAPLDDASYFFLPDHQEGVTLFPFMTARIVDVEQALQAISYPEGVKEELTIKVEDDLAPWNNQSFHLHVQNGKGTVSTTSREAAISIKIGAFTQLLFGRLSTSELYYQDRLQISDMDDVKRLNKIFPKCNNYINEYY